MNTTPTPNKFFDAYLPRLRDTEARVLLIVIRSTLGWVGRNGTRKKRDWISHRQLQQRTGRTSEPVSSAVDSLVRQGLIEVEDERGRLLRTVRSRQSRFGKLFYSLGPLLWESDSMPALETRSEESGTTKANKNKNKLNNKGFKTLEGKRNQSARGRGWSKASEVKSPGLGRRL